VRTLIALTGDSSKGKGTVADILRRKGFVCFPLSDVIKIEAKKMGWPTEDRKVLQTLGDLMRLKEGNDVLVARTFRLEGFKMADNVVIDGVRHPDEIELIKDVFDHSVLIAVDMSDERALGLIKERNRAGDPKTMEEYMALKERERGVPGSNAMQMDKCLEMADIKLWNEGKVSDLERDLDSGLRGLGIELSEIKTEMHSGHNREIHPH